MKKQRTTDYEQFKFIDENRSILPGHVDRLVKSIQVKNLLEYEPMKVNERMEVIDGQHRLLAARKLGVDIWYEVIKGLGMFDVLLLNPNQAKWGIQDYLNLYVKQGYDNYIYLKEFSSKHRLSISTSVAILSCVGKPIGNITANLMGYRRGDFRVFDKEKSVEFVELLLNISKYTDENTWRDRDFISTMYRLMNNEDVDMDYLIEKTKQHNSMIYRRATVVDYLRQFEDIYNYGLRSGALRFY